MAKKKSVKKKAAPKKASAAKAASKKAPKMKQAEVPTITLDAVEEKALQMVEADDVLCDELETAATKSIIDSLRKVYKKHGIALTETQAQNVAISLFGEDE